MTHAAKRFWLSSDQMTVTVAVDAQDRIIEAAPVVRRFMGQPLANLLGWMQRQGGLHCELL